MENENQGLTQSQASEILEKEGPNVLFQAKANNPFRIVFEILMEPMMILLVMASSLYFILGKFDEGWMLVVAILLVASISIFQTIKSTNAILALGKLSRPLVKIWRDGKLAEFPVEEVVPGDYVLVEEGMTIPADGLVISSNDLQINEARITGESLTVTKEEGNELFSGTEVVSGSILFKVVKTGNQTVLGKLGKSLNEIKKEKTFLQKQIDGFVKKMAWIGFIAFALILGVNFFRTHDFYLSLLQGLTIAMALIPEEIPVAFASFMALGAVRLSKVDVLAKEPQTVESLGSATVICTDKTGTLTTEGMDLSKIETLNEAFTFGSDQKPSEAVLEVLFYARIASEPLPFDAMEKAIDVTYVSLFTHPWDWTMEKEYPLSGKPPMMTHIFKSKNGEQKIGAKGGLETILAVCKVPPDVAKKILERALDLSKKGLRILGMAKVEGHSGSFPEKQEDFNWQFLGILALYNPPKKNAKEVVSGFYKAGIQVKMITGDFSETASAIARLVGIENPETVLTGEEIMKFKDQQLRKIIPQTNVYARMFPDAKLHLVNTLKAMGEVVAMTGDGVNDGPSLKAAHIGIAMGKKGTEVARQAASLVLVKDDLSKMLKAIALGRKIYMNLKKAISYIVSIHIPIILTVTTPLVFGWEISGIFDPIHIIFLELVMGPTCSIAFESEPEEPGIMQQKPRSQTDSFFSSKELLRNITQGIVLAVFVLTVFYTAMSNTVSKDQIRTLVFTSLVFGNVFLTLANRSVYRSVLRTIFTPNPILWLMLGITCLILFSALYIPVVQGIFHFAHIPGIQILYCLAGVLPAVFWIEIPKWWYRRRKPNAKGASF